MKWYKLVLLTAMLSFGTSSFGQFYTEDGLRAKLDSMSVVNVGLKNVAQLNVSGLPLYEFIYALGIENNVNLTVDPTLNQAITYNFYDASVKDILVFLYVNFELEYYFVGNIISVKKRTELKSKVVTKITQKPLDIKYNVSNDFLSLNLQNDTLWKVMEQITTLSNRNFVIKSELRNKLVNAFFQNRPFDQVLEMFATANDVKIEKGEDGMYNLDLPILDNTSVTSSTPKGKSNTATSAKTKLKEQLDGFVLEKNKFGKLDVFADNIDVIDIVKLAAQEVNCRYVFHTNVDGKANLDLKDVSFEELLKNLFMTTKFNYVVSDNIYIIGERKMEGIRRTELIRMENRTIENVKTAIPKELLTDIDVSEFLELNGLIVSGSEKGIVELKNFLSSIDVVVPMVQIDVMLMFSNKGSNFKTGMQAGLKNEPTITGGTIFPGLDVEAGASTLNNILNAISGFGLINLGQVTENFYASLSALESNNVISIESTPKISTLNGQKASISIGEKTYYQETQVNVQTSVTQQGVLQSKVWKSIDANLSVNIQPFVSSDEQITLTIKVNQDDFSGKVDPSSPPNMTTQTFESMVRVKNGEVILLGGLEKKKNNDSGSGVPFLSRIPFIKWFFSSRTKDQSKSKLHILIKSTVTY